MKQANARPAKIAAVRTRTVQRAAMAIAAATTACTAKARPASTLNMNPPNCDVPSWGTGLPNGTDTVNAYRTTTATAHSPAVQRLACTARADRPWTSSDEPGRKNTAVTSRPTVTMPAMSAVTCENGRPQPVSSPGSGIPGGGGSGAPPPRAGASTKARAVASSAAAAHRTVLGPVLDSVLATVPDSLSDSPLDPAPCPALNPALNMASPVRSDGERAFPRHTVCHVNAIQNLIRSRRT